jgi:hypothetical protein
MNANTGISSSGATINWSSTNQSYSYVNSTYLGFANSYTFSGLSSSTFYSGTVTVYSSTGNTASASYSFTTSAPPVTIPATPTGVSLSGSGAVNWSAVSGATYYEVLNYTARSSTGASRLGPYTTTVYGTSLQLGSSQGYSGLNNYARVQVRAGNSAGVSLYGAWVPSATTYT